MYIIYTVSIPQAVSTVATTIVEFVETKKGTLVSIPQAVSTVATFARVSQGCLTFIGFNTASGKYCCNSYSRICSSLLAGFNTASGKYCCNAENVKYVFSKKGACFNTASGKYCCNACGKLQFWATIAKFQYRKR